MAVSFTDIYLVLGLEATAPDGQISRIAPLSSATETDLSFLDNPKYKNELVTTKAHAVLVRAEFAQLCPNHSIAIIVANPYMAYAKVASLFDSRPEQPAGIHPSAVISEQAQVDPSAHIGAKVIIESGARVGKHVVIQAGTVVGHNTHIGDNTHIFSNVTLYHETKIGDDCVIQSGAVIGSDGFGNARDENGWLSIPQIGRVVIGNEVHIGANTCVDRGAMDDTVISDQVRIDNLVQIAHNVVIGEGTAIAGCAGIAGSVQIGKNCLIAGGVGISGHLSICDNVIVTANSGVPNSIKEPGIYSSGVPAQPHQEWRRNVARLKQLNVTTKKVTQLEKQFLSKVTENE